MEYKITLYKNSGYNLINVPDTPSRLSQDAEEEALPSVNLLQNRRLKQITVACSNESAEAADYIRIGNMYYAITSFAMQSVSTCTFEIVEKPLLSVGGIKATKTGVEASFDLLDGITSRCTVSDDDWGRYTSDDPLTAPQEPLQLETEWLVPSGGSTPSTIDGDPILIESTVDLSSQAFNLTGDTYTDDKTGETVTVPKTCPIKTSQEDFTAQFGIDGVKKSNGTAIFCRNDTGKTNLPGAGEAGVVIDKGLSVVRQLGIESGSIISQYRLPKEFCGGMQINYPIATGSDGADTAQRITEIDGVKGKMSSDISPDYYPVKNKRVLYGSYNKYGMITCAGNSAEFRPEDLGGETAPDITYISDPRSKGKPYYRFTEINKNDDFWRNCLAGAEWESVPLLYQGGSGSALNRLNFDNDQKMAETNLDYNNTRSWFNLVEPFARMGAGIIGIAAGAMTTGETAGTGSGVGVPLMMSGLSNIITGGRGLFNVAQGQSQYSDQYTIQRENELSRLYQSTNVYAPSVNFPYNADILRDVKGNGVLIYKYRLSDHDAARVDKLLTMYGYKTSEPLTLDHFQAHEKFDYIACSSVTVTGTYPQWLLDDIADELKNGIRIWHVKPDDSAYIDNPVRSV